MNQPPEPVRPVRMAISPTPAHVRTARLVAVAVARQVGVADELLDEIRLAVGEACTRAVGVHQQQRTDELVEVEFFQTAAIGAKGQARFVISVRDQGQYASVEAPGHALARLVGSESIDEHIALELAVVMRLVDEVRVGPAVGGGTQVTMSWPLGRYGAARLLEGG